jgi:zinc/manganese transport system substrate-binding protein
MHRRALLLSLPCLPAAARAAAAPSVVASFSILADLAREVAGPAAAVRALVGPDGDVHAYEPRPSDLLALRAAALVVTNGLGLEGWLDRLLPAAGARAPVVVATRAVAPRRLGNGLDPHAWQDPGNAVLYVRAIAEGLAAVLPAAAPGLHARADDYIRRLEATDAWIEQQFAPIPRGKRRILTSHDAFFYFGARYGIEFVGVQGIDTDAEPSAADIATLVRQIRSTGIKAVFVENMASPRLARVVALESGAALGPVVYSDALSPPGGPAPTTLAMFRHNTAAFVAAMRAT